jgi:hypothetical protein
MRDVFDLELWQGRSCRTETRDRRDGDDGDLASTGLTVDGPPSPGSSCVSSRYIGGLAAVSFNGFIASSGEISLPLAFT